ncbi:MAG: J domain-containing protein [Desulfobulbales bacterium]|nr:J domain-containing protein [Desulfobulbales bacterium]
MTGKDWKNIKAAAELLGLEESATLAEIKKAYRRLCKKHHPDVQKGSQRQTGNITMHELTEAYRTLLQYCAEYRFPLVPGENEPLEGEDWWFERFGQDYHWGKGTAGRDDPDK